MWLLVTETHAEKKASSSLEWPALPFVGQHRRRGFSSPRIRVLPRIRMEGVRRAWLSLSRWPFLSFLRLVTLRVCCVWRGASLLNEDGRGGRGMPTVLPSMAANRLITTKPLLLHFSHPPPKRETGANPILLRCSFAFTSWRIFFPCAASIILHRKINTYTQKLRIVAKAKKKTLFLFPLFYAP